MRFLAPFSPHASVSVKFLRLFFDEFRASAGQFTEIAARGLYLYLVLERVEDLLDRALLAAGDKQPRKGVDANSLRFEGSEDPLKSKFAEVAVHNDGDSDRKCFIVIWH